MGLLIDGTWHDEWYDTKKTDGRFVRPETSFRNLIGDDGDFTAEPGRYHLYVSHACPWAHRTMIFREIKGLNDIIGVSVVNPLMLDNGWTLDPGADGINRCRYLYQIYLKADPGYSGRVSVPVLWDRKRETIVNNESSEIIRILNSAFDRMGAREGDYYPADLRGEIDAINEVIYETVNNGVYRAGFATTQDAYEDAYDALFATLDDLEARLSRQRYLLGGRITEADWRLFTTLVRFDAVYFCHFKCNKRRIVDYPNLWGYVRDLYQMPGIAATVNMDHIKSHYFISQKTVNPSAIVAKGPDIDFNTPHDRS